MHGSFQMYRAFGATAAQNAQRKLRRLTMPVLAVGGALSSGDMVAATMNVVADDVQFCMKEPSLGLVPDLAGTKPLVELVGASRALEICATARFVEADEALELGIATVVERL